MRAHGTAEMHVFLSIAGRALDQQAFSRHWYDCLRSLDIRQRGICCTKDTFVSTALGVGANVRWLEQQTGENYATLKKHDGEWVPPEMQSELRKFERVAPNLFRAEERKLSATYPASGGQFPVTARNPVGFEVVPRGFEPLLPT
jgi:hypothetical protein